MSRIKKARYTNIFDSSKNDESGIDLTQLLQQKDSNVYMESNHIYFRDDVSMESVGKLCSLIDDYNRSFDELSNTCKIGVIDPLPLYLHITSYGGDLLGGFMAYDYIKNSKIPVYTVSEGYTVSSGSVMFMAGRKRLMIKNSYFLAHQLSQSSYGSSKFADIMDTAQNTTGFMSKLYKIYLDNIRHKDKPKKENVLTKEKLEQHMARDIYWNFEECVKYGIVDDEYINYIESNLQDSDNIRKGRTFVPLQQENKLTEKDLVPSKTIISRLRSKRKNNSENDETDEKTTNDLAKTIIQKMFEEQTKPSKPLKSSKSVKSKKK